MASITFALDEKLKSRIIKFPWINLSELVRQELMIRQELIKNLNSKEEKELTSWSVELGRKAKKERFRKLLSELPKNKREELLKSLNLQKRKGDI